MDINIHRRIVGLTQYAIIGLFAVLVPGTILFLITALLKKNIFANWLVTLLIVQAFAVIVFPLVNISSHLAILANSNTAERVPSRKIKKRTIAIILICVAAISIGGEFLISYFERMDLEAHIEEMQAVADRVVETQAPVLDEMYRLVKADPLGNIHRLGDISDFLTHQNKLLPSLRVIFQDSSGTMKGHKRFSVNTTQGQLGAGQMSIYVNWYSCINQYECSNFDRFFYKDEGAKFHIAAEPNLRAANFVYVPYVGKEGKFILVFGDHYTPQ